MNTDVLRGSSGKEWIPKMNILLKGGQTKKINKFKKAGGQVEKESQHRGRQWR